MNDLPTLSPERLLDFAASIYAAEGMPPADAHLAADTLVQADLWGHQSHGVMRLPWYVARLRAGTARAVAQPEYVTDAGAVAVIDGHDAMGQVLTAHAAEDVLRRARKHGIGAVALRNSNHFGTAMYYTRKAADHGCIMFLTTNASPAMAPWGGLDKLVGNNPWSWAAPAGRHAPMVLDIANTAVARGKIYQAQQRGTPLPPGWAVDVHGEPTTSPSEALAGLIQPMGGHKGYAISVLMDVLAGVLTGSGFGPAISGPYQAEKRSHAGHLLIALDIEAFVPLATFEAQVEAMIETLHGVRLAKGAEQVFYPGEVEALNDLRFRREGLSLSADTLRDLGTLADEAGLARPW